MTKPATAPERDAWVADFRRGMSAKQIAAKYGAKSVDVHRYLLSCGAYAL